MLAEVARLVVTEGYNLEQALERAVHRLGIARKHSRPPRQVLQAAVDEYRELFQPQQLKQLTEQRRLALQAMHSMQNFAPRLFGGLVHGNGNLGRVRLLLQAETPEQVMLHLHDQHIPWREGETTLHFSNDRRMAQPTLSFEAGSSTVELVILDRKHRSDPPRDSLSGGRLELLDIAQLEQLIEN